MSVHDNIRAKTNITLTLIHPDGKRQIYRYHNIWLHYGRSWLLNLMTYDTDGSSPLEDNRIYAIGVGIGGAKQTSSIPSQLNTDYPGNNTQAGDDPTISYLERPVRISQTGTTDTWLKSIDHNSTSFNGSPPPYYVKYIVTFEAGEISYPPYYNVPLSEVGLFHKGEYNLHVNDALADVYGTPPTRPSPVAYTTFYTISKNYGTTLTVEWEIRMSE